MLSADRVAAASAAWVWYPDDATALRDDELVVVRWPAYFAAPPALLRAGSVAALDRAAEQARDWGADELTCWVLLDAPDGLEDALKSRAARPVETLDVFALDLGDGVPDLDAPDLDVRWQLDEATTRDQLAVAIAAFEEGEMPDDDQVRRLTEQAVDDHRTGRGGTAIAYLDGEPVASGGLTLADGVARLWGGGVVPAARGRGAYRAVLAARLAHAVENGVAMALVKGRVETSGPILRRAGFASYGQERSYRLSL